MNKKVYFGLLLFLGLSLQTYAGSGQANDGLLFTLVVTGVLLAILGLFQGIDYLKKNGRTLFYKFNAFLKNKINALIQLLKKVSFWQTDLIQS